MASRRSEWYNSLDPERKEQARERMREYTRRHRESLKRAFIQAYGGECACPGCHESDPVFMCIDHVDGDGTSDYRRKGLVTRQLMARAKADGWPPIYQVLCWNCNSAKHILGSLERCPHNLKR